MGKYFEISGYWKDDKSEFSRYIVSENDEIIDDVDDDLIFYYGMNEEDIKDAIKLGKKTANDFVITSYSETTLN